MKTFAKIGLALLAAAMLSLTSCQTNRGAANPYARAQQPQYQNQNPYATAPAYGQQPAAPQGGGYPNYNDYVDVQPVQQPTQTSPASSSYVQPPAQQNPYSTTNPYGQGGAYSNQPAPYVPPSPSTPTAYAPPPQSTTPVSGYRGTYTVVRGDTLYSIGRRHGTSAGAIKSANGLQSDLIFPGDMLNIP